MKNLFQSHTGSIKSFFFSSSCAFFGSFNPTLVRLKVINYEIALSSQPSFNPTLVRLKVLRAGHKKSIGCVSIPHWFD